MLKKLTRKAANWWPWLPPSRGDIIALAIGVALTIVLLYSLIVPRPYFLWIWWNANRGFGPEWDCSYVPQSEPICIKRVKPNR